MISVPPIVYDLIYKIQNKYTKENWKLTGSFINGSFDEYSNLNLVTNLSPDIAYSQLLQLGCKIISHIEDNCSYFEYQGYIVTVSSMDGINNHDMLPLNDFMRQCKINCYHKYIPYINNDISFENNVRKYISDIYITITKIIVSFCRRDKILFQKSIEEFENNILTLAESITKNGYKIDNSRVQSYLHPSIVDAYFSRCSIDELFKKNSLDEVFNGLSNIITIFNVMLYETEILFDQYVDQMAINNVLLRFGIVGVQICPLPDECLSKYSESTANTYDIYRDDKIFATKLKESLKPIVQGKSVFELGVGTGMIAEKIIPYTTCYTGLENSEHMMSIFIKKCRQHKFENVYYIQADMMNIDYYINDTHDIFLERASLMFCLDPLKVINKIIVHAKKGAILLRLDITENHSSVYHEIMNIFDESISDYDKTPIILKEFDDITLINEFLIKKGYSVKKELLFEWFFSIRIDAMLLSLKNKCIPYIQNYSDRAINYALERVKNHIICNGLNEETEIKVKRSLYSYITKF